MLALYNPNADTLGSADASSFGLGAVLTQKQDNDEWLPITYVSRALTPTERRYAQIEKEALAITYACERFQEYIIGKSFHINTDHKRLVPIFSFKSLEELPLRVQRFCLYTPLTISIFNFPHSWQEVNYSRHIVMSSVTNTLTCRFSAPG